MLVPVILPSRVDSVLDVGCGIRPQNIVQTTTHVAVDAFRPYLERASVEHPNPIFIHGRWNRVLPHFMAQSFDVVIALDFIEHLERKDGLRFIEEAKRLGRWVGIFSPVGPLEQSYEPNDLDAWGMEGVEWQTHRSAWQPEDFPEWEIEVLPDFHVDVHRDAFWAVKDTMEE